jgi:acetyltransferase-like isoleucine patch superfamily enzyme
MRELKEFKVIEANSLIKWFKVKNPLKIFFNWFLIFFSQFLPSLALKRWVLRRTGMKIGKNVSIAFGVMFDFFFPELIEIEDNTIIGYNCTILAHEFLINSYRIGRVKIGRNVLIGANSTVLAGVKIGDNAFISAMSLVNKSVKENSFVGGIPIKNLEVKNND